MWMNFCLVFVFVVLDVVVIIILEKMEYVKVRFVLRNNFICDNVDKIVNLL